MNWSDLSMSQRSDLMQIYLKNGITSLDEMKKHYNSFAEGGNIDDPPYKRYYATPQYGFSPTTSQTNVYQPIVTDVQKDIAHGKPIGTTTAKRIIQAKQSEEQPVIKATELPRKTQEEINKIYQTQNILQPINTGLNIAENFPIIGDAITVGRTAADIKNGSFSSATLLPLMLLGNKLPFGKTGTRYSKELIREIEQVEKERAQRLIEDAIERPIGISHNISENNLIKTINNYKGESAAPSLALSRFEDDGLIHSNDGYSLTDTPVALYFEPTILSDNGLYWRGDGFWPTYDNVASRINSTGLQDILSAKRQLYSEWLSSPINLTADRPTSKKEAIDAARNYIHGYAEYTPNDIFNLGNAKYAITTSKNPIILKWLEDNKISTDLDALLSDKSIRFKKGGSLDIPPYTQFLNTLPDNLKNSGDEYNMRRYWELNGYPKDFNEGIQKGMFTKQDDGYHANSVAFNPVANSYEFMKDRNHPTYNMELDWYYSDDPEAVEFRKNYKYTPGIGMIPDQYIPIYRDGGRIHIKPENRGKFTALKERTGHSASWFKENGTPAQKKMAVFELNSRKWKK